MTVTADSPRAVFDRLTTPDRPPRAARLFDTACVLGGSIAGLLAARVLSDYARSVLVIERDVVNTTGHPRTGVPQDRQGHALLPGGRAQIERWLPGFTYEAQDCGGVLVRPDQQVIYLGGEPQMPNRETSILAGTRPFLESQIRSRVLDLPNVSAISARVTGLVFRDDAVQSVRCASGGDDRVIDADFVVDAMGRSSKLSDWVERAGFQRPPQQRLRTNINYATALFERSGDLDTLPLTCAIARFAGRPDGLAIGAAVAVEADQWLVTLTGYEPDRPPTSIDAFRAACATLPPVFGRSASGAVTRGIETYRQADSRRRHFTGLARFPARLVSVGDAVASFNPIHGQGISSAALHASCLSEYLSANPPLDRMATAFFDLQAVVVDAAWTMSAGDDAARMDAIQGVDVPEDVARQRWVLEQVVQATLVDQPIADVFNNVSFMLAHPAALADPALVDRAIAVTSRFRRAGSRRA
jgi:2-polyprenyl-6-methoxyphenol hydroxylase-like FAD-dependent oxidoreductase